MRTEAGGLVGRDGDLRAVLAALTHARLVTLTGPGGVGKTRLAREAVAELETEFDRVLFIDLTIETSDLGASFPDLKTLDVSKTLLLVDNCEHVIEDAASKVHEILQASGKTTVLTTSRRPLHVAGERLHPVGPLSIPPLGGPISDLLTFETVQLFLERSAQLDPSFELSLANAEAVTRICRFSEGLPIAIELAAGLTRSRPMTSIADAMGDREHGSRELPLKRRDIHDHQQSLAKSIGWSIGLLDPETRDLLRCAAVFSGSFSARGVAVVHAAVGGENTAPLLDRLVEHSLASFDQENERFSLLAIVADEVRSATGPEMTESLVAAHTSWALDTSKAIAASATQPDPLRKFPRYQFDLPDLVRAAERLADSRQTETWLELVGPIAEWWVHQGGLVDRSVWEAALGQEDPSEARQVSLATSLAFHFSHLGHHEASLQLALSSRAAAANHHRNDLAVPALIAIGNAHRSMGNPDEAALFYAEASGIELDPPNAYLSSLARLCLARTDAGGSRRQGLVESLELAGADHPALTVIAEQELARLELSEGRIEESSELAQTGAATALRLGFPEAEATAHNTLGSIAIAQCRFADAHLAHQKAIRIGQRTGHSGVIGDGLLGIATILTHTDSPELAARVAKLAFELAPALATPSALTQVVELDGDPLPMQAIPNLLSTMDAELHVDEDETETRSLLTERETGVLLLLRGDLTQREIADEMYVSPSTIRTHVKSIYRKLGVHNRTSCVHHATVLGLLPAP